MRKWLKRILLGAAVGLLAGWATLVWLLRSWTAKPPPLPANTTILQLKPETRGGKTWLGQSWTSRREGLPVIFLKGSPLEIGYAHGVLLREQMHVLENEFIQMIHGYLPQDWKVNLLKWYVIYRNRHLTDYVPLDYRMEIFGTTLGCPDLRAEEGSFYNRLLNYHAAHDISYMMIDHPLVSRAGCTSFGAWGGATEKGHLLTGRNFDWEAAEVFSRDRVVILCEPDGGIPFVSLAWAGMAGVVSGMNREGVSVTLNGAPSGLPEETATPAALVARDVLQRAGNLTEALDIIRRANVFVSTLWLVGSRADGRFVVVEKTPQVTQVREPVGDSIVCANHFQTDGLKNDPRNSNYVAEATSLSRATRLAALLHEKRGSLNATHASELLRDRRLPGGNFAGNHHRGTLNAFIATHAMVMDLTDGIFWAASPPHQLGKFVAFDVNDFSKEMPERVLDADPVIASGEYKRASEGLEQLKVAARALKASQAEAALKAAENAEALNPGFYQNAAARGRALLALGRKAEAAQALEAARNAHPAFPAEQRQLEELWKQAHTP